MVSQLLGPRTKVIKRIVSVCVVVLLIALAGFVVYRMNLIRGQYETVTTFMMSVDSPADVDEIGTLLDEIPSFYKDADAIKREYAVIAGACQRMRSYQSWKSSFSAWTQAGDASVAARAYFESLYRLNESYHDWDLSGLMLYYLEHYRDCFAYGRQWSGVYLQGSEKRNCSFYWSNDGYETKGYRFSDIEIENVSYDGKWHLVLNTDRGHISMS